MEAHFIENSGFTRAVGTYLDDDEYSAFQAWLGADPEAGRVVQGTGGFRKARWRDPRRGKGKRGGLRVIYYWFKEERRIWLVMIYDKDEAGDLSDDEKKALRSAIEAERQLRGSRTRGKR